MAHTYLFNINDLDSGFAFVLFSRLDENLCNEL